MLTELVEMEHELADHEDAMLVEAALVTSRPATPDDAEKEAALITVPSSASLTCSSCLGHGCRICAVVSAPSSPVAGARSSGASPAKTSLPFAPQAKDLVVRLPEPAADVEALLACMMPSSVAFPTNSWARLLPLLRMADKFDCPTIVDRYAHA